MSREQEGATVTSAVDAARASLSSSACPWLADEIAGGDSSILRPFRPLTPQEGMAMLRAWETGYTAAGLRPCALEWGCSDAECPDEACSAEDTGRVECFVLPVSEEHIADALQMLGRRAGQ
jgi:hypothetical protein